MHNKDQAHDRKHKVESKKRTNQRVAEETRTRAFLFTDHAAAVTTVVDQIVFGRLTFALLAAYIVFCFAHSRHNCTTNSITSHIH